VIRVNLHRPERRQRAAFRLLKRFFERVPLEKPALRVDRRINRWVLCGEHGFGRNWREECPQCGGYVERVANPILANRMTLRHEASEENLIRAAAARTVAHIEMQ
jgi:hypothetical protein